MASRRFKRNQKESGVYIHFDRLLKIFNRACNWILELCRKCKLRYRSVKKKNEERHKRSLLNSIRLECKLRHLTFDITVEF